MVSEKGIQVDYEKVRVVAQWPVPSCQQEIKKFLGFASYYRQFVPNFAQVATPLYRLCEQNRAWLWDAECERAFCSLKQLLTSAPILIFPHFDHPFILDVDASATGVGAVLSQVINGHERAVAYASRALTKPERRYCTTRQEMLALVWAAQHFRAYLYGRSFQARTDHQSLKWLRSFKEPEGQVARWLEALAEYDFEVVHRPGRQHINADSLSRQHCQQCGQQCSAAVTATSQQQVAEAVLSVENWLPSWEPEELHKQ